MQEQMIRALVRRVAVDCGLDERAVTIETRNGRGGLPAALTAFREFANGLIAGGEPRPDIVVLALDSDCDVTARRDEVQGICDQLSGYTCIAVAVPDPYVERWYLIDLEALKDALGVGPSGAYPKECSKSYYKTALASAIEAAGLEARIGGYEYADLIAAKMDLYRAGKLEPQLERFTSDLTACLRRAISF
jgi:hypothetical protein